MTLLATGTRVGLSALTAAALVVGVAACGSSNGGGGSQSSSSSATTSGAATGSAAATSTAQDTSNAAGTDTAAGTSTADGTSTGGDGSTGGGATAAPGTNLKIGATATVPLATTLKSGKNGPTYKLKVQVLSMDKGTLADFNGIKLDATEKSSTPYYVKVKITSLGPGKIATTDNDPAVQVEGVDSTGQTQQSVTFFGDFPKCDEVFPPKSMGAGSSFETCLTFLVPGGIRKVAYTGTESYITKPVTWSP
jgi:hypothetical protein